MNLNATPFYNASILGLLQIQLGYFNLGISGNINAYSLLYISTPKRNTENTAFVERNRDAITLIAIFIIDFYLMFNNNNMCLYFPAGWKSRVVCKQ